MSGYIQEQVDKKYSQWEKGLKETFKNEVDSSKFTGEQLAAELKAMRSVEKPTNWFMWKRAHTGRGVKSAWKDMNFFTYLVRELPTSRSAPWVWAGLSTFIFGYLAFRTPEEEHVNSPNFYPYGNPPGSKLNAHYAHLAHADIGQPAQHKRGDSPLAQKHH